MNTNTHDSSKNPAVLSTKVQTELIFLSEHALQEVQVGIEDRLLSERPALSLWALSILELELSPPHELIELINGIDENEDYGMTWIGKLACALVKYSYDKDSHSNSLCFQSVDEDGCVNKRRLDTPTNNALWEVILSAKGELNIDPNLHYENVLVKAIDINSYTTLCSNEFSGITIFRTPSGFRKLEKTVSALRELANDYAEAQYILGLAGDEAEDWMMKASGNLFELASYHLGFYRYANKPLDAIEHLGLINREPKLDDNHENPIMCGLILRDIRKSAYNRIQLLKSEGKEKEIRDKTRIEMLAALSHTLHNSQSTSREIVRSAVRILGSRSSEMSRLESGALNDLTSLYATFDFTDNLIQTFKLLVSDPQKLSVEMMNEQPDLPSIGEVVAYSLRQILVRVIFSESFVSQAFHLVGERNSKALLSLRTDFRREFLVSNEDVNASNLVDWTVKKLPGLQVTLTQNTFRLPLHNQTQYALIFAVVSEMLLNSIRHAGSSQPIEISLEVDGAKTTLSICNCFVGSGEKESIKIGSGGLSFIDNLTKSLCVPGFFDASFDWDIANGKFYTTLVLTDGQEHTDEHRMD